MKEIGVRAMKAIYNRISSEKSLEDLLFDLELNRATLWQWEKNNHTPNGHTLRKMALAGYDVVYILTGERN